MTKMKTTWFCASCGTKQAKWTGQCSGCDAWNSFTEETTIVNSALPGKLKTCGFHQVSKPMKLKEIGNEPFERFHSGFHELDKTLGGGIVPGSLILLGGDPGIGK